ncbi:MAG: peptidoglycan-binding protein [Bryobacteraceae bacterium]
MSNTNSGAWPGGYYQVQDGDWVSKIAAAFGFSDWKRVWNCPENADLRSHRPDPNVIFPGDRIYIPPLRTKAVSCSTDTKHQFRLVRQKKELRIRLQDGHGEPRAGVPCTLQIDNQPCPGVTQTDGDGAIETLIPEGAEQGTLLVGADRSECYHVQLGYLDPIDTIKGCQERLSNLGYYTGDMDGIVGPITQKATVLFQEHENALAGKTVLVVDGIIGPKTKAKLQERHGY